MEEGNKRIDKLFLRKILGSTRKVIGFKHFFPRINEENNRIDKLLPRMARIPKTMLMTQMISQGRV